MSQQFKSQIDAEEGIKIDKQLYDAGNSAGTSGYLLSSTGTATSWVDPAAVSVGESEQVHIACKNTSGVAISKGDPVYITGTVGNSFIIQIAKADASDSAKMPAVGLVETDLGLNDEGFVIVSGILKNLTTDPLSTSDGTPSSNDTVYVKAGGGLTRTKPTGSGNLIQNVGKVGRISSANAGSLAVSTIMRTNDVPNLTTGKIWVGSPTYTTESTVVHLDETNGRMGIGTASPGAPLHLQSSVTNTLKLNNSSNSSVNIVSDNTYLGLYPANYIILGRSTLAYDDLMFLEGKKLRWNETDGSWYDVLVSSGTDNLIKFGSVTSVSTGGDTAFYHNQSEKMRLTSTGLGIGTTSPNSTYKLHVVGKSYLSGGIQMNSGDKIDFGNSNQYITGVNDTSLTLATGGSATLTATHAGNVGIGTTSPNQKLTIHGTNQYVATQQTNYPWGGSVTIGLRMGTDATAGALDFRRWTGTATNHGAALITQVNSDGGYGLDFRVDNKSTNTSATTSRMFLSTSGEVGIGTTSPTEKLHVYNGTAYVTPIPYSSTQAGYALKIGAYNNTNFDMGLQLKSTSGGSPYMSFKTHTTDDVITIWGGSVGIGGIGLPSYTLDVDGQIRCEQYLRLADTGGTNRFSIRAESTYATIDNGSNTVNYNASNHLFLVGVSEKMRINSSGNVGIGTTSPASKLTIGGIGIGNKGGLKIEDPSNTAYGGHFSYDDATSYIHIGGITNNTLNDAIAIERDATRTITISNLENVGIGTNSPSYLLDINEDDNVLAFRVTGGGGGSAIASFVRDVDATGSSVNIGATNNNPQIQFANTGNTFAIGSDTSGNFKISDNGTIGGNDRITINSTGNVGIGTTSPQKKLHVSSGDQATARIRLSNTNTAGGGDDIDLVAGAHNVTQDGFSIYNATSNQTQFVIRGSGNVGIGTNNPSEKLHISGGNLEIENNFPLLIINSDNALGVYNQILSQKQSSSSPPQGEFWWKDGNQGGGSRWTTRLSSAPYTTSYINLPHNSSGGNFAINIENNERLTINRSNGNVGIGTTNPSSYKLDVNGTGRFTSTVTATNFILSSDRNLKENIVDYKPKNLNLKWKEFDWKESKEHQIGLIAQEVEETNPEFVVTNQEGEKSVKYIEILIAKIAELEDRIKQLEK